MHFIYPQIFWTKYFLPHVKIESKISVLGGKISILHRQMTEQLSFEVDEKMVKKQEKCLFKNAFFCSKNILTPEFFTLHDN